MTEQELFDFVAAWRGIYPQFTYSDAVFEVICEDFAEFDTGVVKEAFKDVRRNFERMPSMSEFRQVCLSHQKNEKKAMKKEIEAKFQAVPFLREYIIRAFDKWLTTKPASEREAIEKRIVNMNPLLLSLFQGEWRKGDVYVFEAATILKEEEKAGRWGFDAKAFAAYQERRKQENAEKKAQLKGKLLYFPAKVETPSEIKEELKTRRSPEWRQKQVEYNEQEHLQILIAQRDALKQQGGAA